MQRPWPQTRIAWMILAALLAIAGALLLPARLRGQPPAPGLAGAAQAATTCELGVTGEPLGAAA
jgi:hypothetical protein